MVLRQPVDAIRKGSPLEGASVPSPKAARDELVVKVSVCGVCRTDLDLVEGRLVAPRYPVTPGHQVVGRVAEVGADVQGFAEGDRVGVAWINWACGECRFCLTGRENLCPHFRSTGCDADGGYAEYVAAPAAFAHVIPDALPDASVAPLLCAGAIGWRSLRLTQLIDGEPLGLAGFGASAHLVLQLARHRHPASPIYVFARSETERAFARELGAMWAGDHTDEPPAPLAAIIDTTPAWQPVVEALAKLAPGGRLVINAIRKSRADQEQLLSLDYARHLWMEREIKSVANVTRDDVRQMLSAAVEMELAPTVQELPLEDANTALTQLAGGGGIRGATVLRIP